MRDGDVVPVDRVVHRTGPRRCEMRDDLVTAEVPVHPCLGAPPLLEPSTVP
jgi:hypothetical protein